MNTDKGDNVDETVASEMDVKLDQISQTSVTELNPVPLNPSSKQDVSKTDGTAAMMQLLLSEIKGINNKFDEQSNKLETINNKFDEQQSDSNVKYLSLIHI